MIAMEPGTEIILTLARCAAGATEILKYIQITTSFIDLIIHN